MHGWKKIVYKFVLLFAYLVQICTTLSQVVYPRYQTF